MLENLKAKSLDGKEIRFNIIDLISTEGEKSDGVIYVGDTACYIDSIESVQKSDTTGKPTIINPPEKERIYYFPKGEIVKLKNVCELIVRPSGGHRLKTMDGKHYIIPSGWLYIELDIDDWTI